MAATVSAHQVHSSRVDALEHHHHHPFNIAILWDRASVPSLLKAPLLEEHRSRDKDMTLSPGVLESLENFTLIPAPESAIVIVSWPLI